MNAEYNLSISPEAVKHLQSIQRQKDKPVILRIEINSGGCKGFNTKFLTVDSINDNDIVFKQDGICYICDDVSIKLIDGSMIQFSSNLMGKFFWLDVKNSSDTCSCGSSFSL